MRVVTVAERRRREVARLLAAVDRVTIALGDYARRTGVRFVVFGSVARGDVIASSDLDLMIDGPQGRLCPARDFAEDLCERNGLRHDIQLAPEVGESLMSRIRRDGRSIP